MKKIALITGASSGLWIDFAIQLADKWYHCILVARSEDKLLAVKKDIENQWWTAEIIVWDLSSQVFCQSLVASVNIHKISVFINNAGFGAHGAFESIDSEHQLNMIDLNCKTVTYLMQQIGFNMMKHHTQWHILNVASTGAFQPWPTMATYFATKAFVLSITHAVRFERKDKHIHVAALCPGPTKTAFFEHSQNKTGSLLLKSMMLSSEVVRIGLEWLFAKKKVIIPGFMNKLTAYLGLFMPVDIVMGVVKKIME